MAAWGYVPSNGLKDILDRFVGHPHPFGRIRAQIVKKYLNADAKSTMDIGCGEGFWCMELSKGSRTVFGIDYSESALANARANMQKAGMHFFIARADARKLPAKKEAFEQAVCLDVLEHTKHPKIILSEINRILKKGGALILTVPNRRYLAEPVLPLDFKKHIREMGHVCNGFEYPEIKKMLEDCGFSVEKHEQYGKDFSRIATELMYFVAGSKKIKSIRKKMYGHSILATLVFCMVYPLMQMDRLLPKNRAGACVAVMARKAA